MLFTINIIGAGNLGKTIGHLLAKQQKNVTIGGIYNTSKENAFKAIKFIGSGTYYPTIEELPPADLTLITTPDDAITEACLELSHNPFLKRESIVVHCSGSYTSDVLCSVAKRGCFIASIHPMRSFAKPELSVMDYQGTYCAIEGDERAISSLHFLFTTIGSITYEIDKKNKSSYHAAGVFASNYLITLADQALTCLKEAGVKNDLALHIISSLMKGSVANLETTLSPEQSLTGPIQRGDVATLKKHMNVLLPKQQAIYSCLGKATLELTQHGAEKKECIEDALL